MIYYEAPDDDVFEEVRQKAIEIWSGYDDSFGYASEKIEKVKSLKNFRDNFMYIVGMFDENNKAKLFSMISEKAKKAINDRLGDEEEP